MRLGVAFRPLQAALSGKGGQHADIVVQSTHKMLAALTQSAMLHGRGPRAAALAGRISRALQVLQVQSPCPADCSTAASEHVLPVIRPHMLGARFDSGAASTGPGSVPDVGCLKTA